MLSTFAVRSGAFTVLLRSQAPRVLAVVPVGSRSKSAAAERVRDWEEASKIFYGPERDTKNFPHPVMADRSGKCRMGFIPEEWFNFFYEKTGVTGPYVFGVGLLTTLLSKEIWVIDHGFAEVIGFYGALWFLTRTIGPKFANWMDKRNETTTEERFIKPIRDAKETAQKTIAVNEKAIWREEGLRYLWDAKRENVGLQLEAAYRQRLNEIYKDIKRRLDYQVEVGSVKRRFEQQHLVNWVVHNVKQSITPQQETASIKDCIANLKRLAAANAPPAAPAPAK